MPPAAATAPHKPHTVSSAHARTGSRPDHARRSHFAREIEKGRETEIRALDPRKASFDESSTMIFLKKKTNPSFSNDRPSVLDPREARLERKILQCHPRRRLIGAGGMDGGVGSAGSLQTQCSVGADGCIRICCRLTGLQKGGVDARERSERAQRDPPMPRVQHQRKNTLFPEVLRTCVWNRGGSEVVAEF